MIKNIFLTFFGLFFLAALPAAHAGWLWEAADKDTDFRPYLENGTAPQHAQNRLQNWHLADWAQSKAAGARQLDRFFGADIFTAHTQPDEGARPATVTVGPSFYHLSSYDKKRVVMLFDYVYTATAAPSGTLYIQDASTNQIIGTYTRGGTLSLQ